MVKRNFQQNKALHLYTQTVLLKAIRLWLLGSRLSRRDRIVDDKFVRASSDRNCRLLQFVLCSWRLQARDSRDKREREENRNKIKNMVKEKYSHFVDGGKVLRGAAETISTRWRMAVVKTGFEKWRGYLESLVRLQMIYVAFADALREIQRRRQEINCLAEEIVAKKERAVQVRLFSGWAARAAIRKRGAAVRQSIANRIMTRAFKNVIDGYHLSLTLRKVSAYYDEKRLKLSLVKFTAFVAEKRVRSDLFHRRGRFYGAILKVFRDILISIVYHSWRNWSHFRIKNRMLMRRTRRRDNRLFTLLVEKTRKTKGGYLQRWKIASEAIGKEEDRDIFLYSSRWALRRWSEKVARKRSFREAERENMLEAEQYHKGKNAMRFFQIMAKRRRRRLIQTLVVGTIGRFYLMYLVVSAIKRWATFAVLSRKFRKLVERRERRMSHVVLRGLAGCVAVSRRHQLADRDMIRWRGRRAVQTWVEYTKKRAAVQAARVLRAEGERKLLRTLFLAFNAWVRRASEARRLAGEVNRIFSLATVEDVFGQWKGQWARARIDCGALKRVLNQWRSAARNEMNQRSAIGDEIQQATEMKLLQLSLRQWQEGFKFRSERAIVLNDVLMQMSLKEGFAAVKSEAVLRTRVAGYIDKWQKYFLRSRNEGFQFWRQEVKRVADEEEGKRRKAEEWRNKKLKSSFIYALKEECLMMT